jgi:hypothetical protein
MVHGSEGVMEFTSMKEETLYDELLIEKPSLLLNKRISDINDCSVSSKSSLLTSVDIRVI